MKQLAFKEPDIHQTRNASGSQTAGKIKSLVHIQPLISTIMLIARQAIKASASSILLSEEAGKKLIFIFADGPIGPKMSRLKISKQSGIAGWVARNNEPLIVHDVYNSKYFNKFSDEITGYRTNSVICVPMVVNYNVIGVVQVVNKLNGEFNEKDLQILKVVSNSVARLIEFFGQSQSGLVTHSTGIHALVSVIDALETCLPGHSKRVSQYAVMVANVLSLSKEERQAVEYAAILHDIGKIGFGTNILTKMDNEESDIAHKHPIRGYNMLKQITYFNEAGKIILHHHERFDGKGHPRGLKGNAIPVGARLIAVADAFDNLTGGNSNDPKLSNKDALNALQNYAGSQLDPLIVKAFHSGFTSTLPG
ncbi:HD domain-containing phosphohydrolase [Chloroflexota bacterium]